jgi:hypothetical protein
MPTARLATEVELDKFRFHDILFTSQNSPLRYATELLFRPMNRDENSMGSVFSTSREAIEAHQAGRWHVWFPSLLLCVVLTPAVRLPGAIPARLDDLLVFGAATVLAARFLFGLRVPRLDQVFCYTLLVVGTILLSTFLAPAGFGVTAKDYLDCLRPIKFFLVYMLVKDSDPAQSMRTFIRVMSNLAFILLPMACAEMFFARVAPGGLLVRFFSLFTEKSPDLLLDMMATRPFATFNTPPDLGYVACVCLFAGPLMAPARRRKIVVAAFFLILLITASRMFLFSLPLLILLQAALRARSVGEALKRLRLSMILILAAATSSIVLLPLISPHAAEFTKSMITAVATGDTGDEYSITTRLANLSLVDYTWERAPALGVGTRALLPDYVDSELILTFHRYGLCGLAALLLIYPLGFRLARHIAGTHRDIYQLTVISLVTTFLAGITLGALDNSRTGVLLMVILGIAGGIRDRELACSGPSGTLDRICNETSTSKCGEPGNIRWR